VLNVHVLPVWRDWRLRDMERLAIQQWVADKFHQGTCWQTVRNARVLLSSILETAVEYGYLQTKWIVRLKKEYPHWGAPKALPSRFIWCWALLFPNCSQVAGADRSRSQPALTVGASWLPRVHNRHIDGIDDRLAPRVVGQDDDQFVRVRFTLIMRRCRNVVDDHARGALRIERQPISELKLCADPLYRTACPPSVSKPSAPAIVRNGRV
jgi:hypothetical protein